MVRRRLRLKLFIWKKKLFLLLEARFYCNNSVLFLSDKPSFLFWPGLFCRFLPKCHDPDHVDPNAPSTMNNKKNPESLSWGGGRRTGKKYDVFMAYFNRSSGRVCQYPFASPRPSTLEPRFPCCTKWDKVNSIWSKHISMYVERFTPFYFRLVLRKI